MSQIKPCRARMWAVDYIATPCYMVWRKKILLQMIQNSLARLVCNAPYRCPILKSLVLPVIERTEYKLSAMTYEIYTSSHLTRSNKSININLLDLCVQTLRCLHRSTNQNRYRNSCFLHFRPNCMEQSAICHQGGIVTTPIYVLSAPLVDYAYLSSSLIDF